MKRGSCCLALSTNSRCASDGCKGSSRQTVSPVTPRGSRLVARIRILRQPPSSAAASSAEERITCSQLSRTSRRSRSARYRRSASDGVAPDRGRTPSTRAVSAATLSGPGAAVRSTSHTPSPRRPICRRASSRAKRVFPTPPGPVSVARRLRPRISSIDSSSRPRPISGVSASGRFVAPRGSCVVAITCQDHRRGSRRRPNRFDARQKSGHVGDQTPRVNPGPFLSSNSPFSEAVRSRRITAGSQFPARVTNRAVWQRLR
jgi:hypothetical protein